ncbi:serine protease [Amycolatopsis sp. NPDC004079]|uniref:S1 family peptidase n=1 Tax=Amycolatopsis sp. NPDC004079 TaxID=3154549 RepID=UPI0033A25CB7
MGYQAERRRWRVRLRDRTGGIRGAGTMLDEDHVLTCAHVVERAGGPDADVLIDFVGLPGTPVRIGRVAPGAWVPPGRDERGDIAVLRLAERVPGAWGAPLYRMPLSDGQAVRAYGFPAGADEGLWTFGELAGEGGPGCEWVQLARKNDDQPITGGFSGTAVLDEETGRVVGMVVSRYKAEGERVAWMIPVETILGYLGADRWGQGSPAVDQTFGRELDRVAYDPQFAREVVGWFGEGHGVWIVVTGEAGSAKAAALDLAVVLADRERSAAANELRDTLAKETLPPAGSVDLAVDAAGKTSAQVRQRLAERLDLTLDNGATHSGIGRTVVVNAIDDAAEPEQLIGEVIAPLADRAARLGIRLALGFRRESSPGLTELRSRRNGGRPDGLARRISALDKQIDELAVLEEHIAELVPRFAVNDIPPPRVRRRRGAVNRLQEAADLGDVAWAERHVEEVASVVAADLAAAKIARDRLNAAHERRTELRFRLDGYGERARAAGRVEDPLLDSLYANAWQLLYEGACEPEAAAAAVEEFGAAVRKGSR